MVMTISFDNGGDNKEWTVYQHKYGKSRDEKLWYRTINGTQNDVETYVGYLNGSSTLHYYSYES